MLLIWFLCFIFLSPVIGICPNGSIPYFYDRTMCFSFQNQKLNYIQAEGVCIGLSGHLASVHNMFENMFITEMTNFTESTVADFWFGANNVLNPGILTWMDGTPFDFADWEKGQPQNFSGMGCGAVKIQDGRWITDDCYKEKPFVCIIKVALPTTTVPSVTTTTTTATRAPTTTTTTTKVTTTTKPITSTSTTRAPTTTTTRATTTTRPTTTTTKATTTRTSTTTKPITTTTTTVKPKICPQGWTLFNYTGLCYKLFGKETWLSGETKCKQNGAHLASIHNLKEDNFVADLGYYSGSEVCNGTYHAWIGIYTENKGKILKWSDGTTVDYQNWYPGQPFQNRDTCGIIAVSPVCGKPKGTFHANDCTMTANIICKK